MINPIRNILLFLSLIIFSSSVLALGKIGHRVVGQIAQNHLTPEAQKQVRQILDNETLAQVANWPDFMRSDSHPFWNKYSVSWHYVSIPEGKNYASSSKNPKGDIYVAINAFVEILKGHPVPAGPIRDGLTFYFGDLSKPENQHKIKKFALSFLTHLVGDLHQPLHTGHLKDKGGNTIRLKWFGEPTNLHAIWDSKLIDFTQLSYTEMVAFIDTTDQNKVALYQQSRVKDWLNESLMLREKAYKVTKKNLRYEYYYQNYPIIKHQMLKAGIRLAGLLNRIFTAKKD